MDAGALEWGAGAAMEIPATRCSLGVQERRDRAVLGGTPQQAFDAAKAGGPPVPGHHSPLFKIDPEPSVRLGTEAMTVAVLDLLTPAKP